MIKKAKVQDYLTTAKDISIQHFHYSTTERLD